MSFGIYAFGHGFIDLFSSPNLESPVSCILSSRDFSLTSVLYKYFSATCPCRSLPEDDVDLEALVNDMNSSLESLYSTCSGQQTESTPLLQNGQPCSSHHHHHHHHMQHNQPRHSHQSEGLSHVSPELHSSSSVDSPQTGLRRSQPMHILAVRYLSLWHIWRCNLLFSQGTSAHNICLCNKQWQKRQ